MGYFLNKISNLRILMKRSNLLSKMNLASLQQIRTQRCSMRRTTGSLNVDSFFLVIVWPLLSIPAGKFTKTYFSFWVFLSIAWGFGAAIVITFLPIIESSDEIAKVYHGVLGHDKDQKVEYVPREDLEKYEDDDNAVEPSP